ncbi:MAG TPA: ATP-dependent Clp protease adaptor ClpS [Chloroflexota bacterium]|jgi:ATP-dependent Clp protease adaptor protein ClpS|nr:ATP-dependent Clp protease adaptor ClpS [Chloroflexota bacterium]
MQRPTAPASPGGPAVAPERAPVRDFDPQILTRRLPPYKVVVHNNSYNTFEEVIAILIKAVPGMNYGRASALANEIHTTGAAVPYVGPKEHAEAVAAVIRTIGIKVTVEPEA